MASCGDDDAIFSAPDETTTTTSLVIVEQAPFDEVVGVVVGLGEDDVFRLLDSLGDEEYFSLLDEVGVSGDFEFVEQLDVESATLLVERLDESVFAELLALGAGGAAASDEQPPSTSEPTSSGTVTNAANDIRRLDAGPLGTAGTVAVEIGPGDMSFLAFARVDEADEQVFVTAVISPSGVDVGEAIGLEYGELSNFGEAAFYAPLVEEVDLEVGVYQVEFEATADIVESGAFIRSGVPEGIQAMDVIFWMATTETYDRGVLETRFRDIAADVFGPHEITVGAMTFIDPPQDIIDRYAVLDFSTDDSDLRGLCREMSESVGPVRALNFAIVDRLDGGGDGVIEGSASGLPGTVMLPGSPLSCVAGMASPDPFEPERDLVARAIVIWHEAAHHLGLYHTTEEDGLFFDIISDTPECPVGQFDTNDDGFVDAFECESVDGGNFMFYDSDGTTMTDGQAWSLRRHPLLYPAG